MQDSGSVAARTRQFIRSQVLGVEDDFDGDVTAAGGDELRIRLQAGAREQGIFAPHAPVEYGGLGLNMVDRAPVFEAAGEALFGPMALNINAPDEGNVHLLDIAASPAQREQYLAPLAKGESRSAFAMTEPSPGAGADPSSLSTAATRVDGKWRIDGRKIFITGGDGAGFHIIMARTSGEAGDTRGATMFLVPADRRGIEIVRHVPTQDRSMVGGHCEIEYSNLQVTGDDVLGEVDEGFRYAQIRLAPARLTHVMRWTGAAVRAHETAVRYVTARSAFGGPLADNGMIQAMIADNEIDLEAVRALLLSSCRELDAGERGTRSSSIAKAFAGEALYRVVDRSAQMCGGMGVSADLPIARIARELRPFRIYDGPTDVHRWSIAKRAVKEILRAEP